MLAATSSSTRARTYRTHKPRVLDTIWRVATTLRHTQTYIEFGPLEARKQLPRVMKESPRSSICANQVPRRQCPCTPTRQSKCHSLHCRSPAWLACLRCLCAAINVYICTHTTFQEQTAPPTCTRNHGKRQAMNGCSTQRSSRCSARLLVPRRDRLAGARGHVAHLSGDTRQVTRASSTCSRAACTLPHIPPSRPLAPWIGNCKNLQIQVNLGTHCRPLWTGPHTHLAVARALPVRFSGQFFHATSHKVPLRRTPKLGAAARTGPSLLSKHRGTSLDHARLPRPFTEVTQHGSQPSQQKLPSTATAPKDIFPGLALPAKSYVLNPPRQTGVPICLLRYTCHRQSYISSHRVSMSKLAGFGAAPLYRRMCLHAAQPPPLLLHLSILARSPEPRSHRQRSTLSCNPDAVGIGAAYIETPPHGME